MYRAYYGPAGHSQLRLLKKDGQPFREFHRLDDALLWARCVARKGTAVLAIDGDDGTQLGRGEITVALRDNSPPAIE
jgi:hypothetical protein